MTQESASTIEQDLAEAISPVSKLRRDDYPPDWQIVKLGEIIDIQGGSQPPKDQFIYEPREGYIRLLQIRDFGEKPVPTYVPKDKVTKFCNKEDIFIARYGASLGRIVTNMEGAYNVALAKVIFDCAVVFPKYMFYLLQTPYFQTPIHMISRSAQNGFNKGEIFPIEVPLAPLQSQKRIVAEIEKQFSRLDEAVANLKRVKANLKRYKASVLKAAVEGKLTKEWRKAHPDIEPASKLLQHILAERRTRCNVRGKYKEPAKPDVSNLPPLPEKWTWTSVDQLTAHITSGSRDWTRYYGRGIGTFILAQNVRLMRLDLSERQAVDPPKSDAETARTRVSIGDLLVTIVGAKTGEVCRIPMELVDHFVCLSVALLRPLMPASAKFMELYLASPENGQAQWKHYIYGQGRPHLSFEQLKMTAIALPPLAEQQQIVAEVERRLSVIDELEAAVLANLTRANRLRQAILSQAFSGRLLGQDTKHIPDILPTFSVAAESQARYGRDDRARR